MEQQNAPESDISRKLRHAESESKFWEKWKGTPEGALAHLTDDIYAYEAENTVYGKGIAIVYDKKHFWFSPENKILFNAVNERITSEELKSLGNSGAVLSEQVNRLIGLALSKLN